MSKFVKVAKISAIADQSATCIKVEGKSIALFNLGGELYAIDDTCPHAGASLSEEGIIEGEEVECSWHGSRFNIKSGDVTEPPASDGVTKYNVRLTGDDIEIEIIGSV
jgi:nitrite reductase/ring-hydroxylating ferredoxin subunit